METVFDYNRTFLLVRPLLLQMLAAEEGLTPEYYDQRGGEEVLK